MGPYCNFCNNRCFTYLDIAGLPEVMIAAYREHPIDIIATCQRGQAAEKERIGYCYDDIKEARIMFQPQDPCDCGECWLCELQREHAMEANADWQAEQSMS